VIARTWRGLAAVEHADAYFAHVTGPIFDHLGTLAGYEGGWVLRRPTDRGIEFLVVTLWTSVDSIRAFAGQDVTTAIVHPDARALLTTWDERVEHFDVAYVSLAGSTPDA
jgi:heme-degrading monooxygenase HmoA